MAKAKSPRDKHGRFLSKKLVAEQTTQQEPPPPLPPSSQVLDLPELLEMILLGLPMLDLLLSQRVCQRWRSLITTSIHLRRALFFEPAACGDVSYIDWRLDDKDFYPELDLGEHLRGPNRDQRPKPYRPHWGRTRNDVDAYRVFFNPLLAKIFPFVSGDEIYAKDTLHAFPKHVQREEASWRRMYFTQPPINSLAIEWDSEGEEDGSDWTVSAVQKAPGTKGLTMESLFLRLMLLDREAWIEGAHLWEEWQGTDDLRGFAAASRGIS